MSDLNLLHIFFTIITKPIKKARNSFSQLVFHIVEPKILDKKILFLTTVSSLLFSITLVGPYLLIYLMPNFKLTIISIGSIGNFLATIPLIFYVDYILYSYMDKSVLIEYLFSYILGRALGFLLFAIILTIYLLRFF